MQEDSPSHGAHNGASPPRSGTPAATPSDSAPHGAPTTGAPTTGAPTPGAQPTNMVSRGLASLPRGIQFAINAIANAEARLRPYIWTVVACIAVIGIGAWFHLTPEKIVLGVLGVLLLVGAAFAVGQFATIFPAWLRLVLQCAFVAALCVLLYLFLGYASAYAEFQKRTLTAAPPPRASAPQSLVLNIQMGSTYFKDTTASFQDGSNDGRLKTSQYLLIKETLATMSSSENVWQSVVLTADRFVTTATSGATYALDVYRIENHGVDYAKTDRPLVAFLGWIERENESGWLELLPVKCEPDATQPHFHIRFTLPPVGNTDKLVICIQRRPMAKPSVFEPGETCTVQVSQ